MDWLAKPARVIAVRSDCAQHNCDVFGVHLEAIEDVVSEQCTGRRVAVSADDITDVVQIACDRGQFLVSEIVFQQPHDIASDAGDQPNVSEAMFGEPEHP
jgi:hypothetical protein